MIPRKGVWEKLREEQDEGMNELRKGKKGRKGRTDEVERQGKGKTGMIRGERNICLPLGL